MTAGTEWWQRTNWQRWLGELFRFYALKSSYRVRFNPQIETACVSLAHRDAQFGTNISLPPPTARGTSADVFTNRLLQLEGLVAHEAGHVRHSDPKPPGTLGELWNIIEDERIERLMVRRYPRLGALFDLLGDHYLGTMTGHDPVFTGLRACLAWRWGHDQPQPITITEPQWDAVLPLLEAGWNAATSSDVTDIARAILVILSIEEDATPPASEVPVSAPRDLESPAIAAEGRSLGATAGNAPAPLEPGPGEAALERLEAPARRLATRLRPLERPSHNRPHASRGRYDYGREVSGSPRPFLQRHSPRRPRALDIRLLIDVSHSMTTDAAIDHAIALAITVQRACELGGCAFRAAAFNGLHLPFTLGGDPLRDEIARLCPDGGTVLEPSLAWALTGNAPHTRAVVIIVSDGNLSPGDAAACRTLVARHPDVTAVPVLIGAARDQYIGIFGRALEVSGPHELAATIQGWLGAIAAQDR